jgi:hypothetical protein
VLRIACRRVLSSTPLSIGFGNLVRQRGKETYKLELTNKNYKYYNGLESGKQVVGPVSAQALVDWRLWEEDIEMELTEIEQADID